MPLVSSTEGLRIVFSVVFVSLVLTLYEVGMFFYVVAPQIREQIDSNFDKVPVFDDIVNKYLEDKPYLNELQDKVSDVVYKVFETLEEREAILVTRINDYTKATGVVMIAVLVLTLVFLDFVVRSRGEVIGWYTYGTVVMTFVPILLFQYVFYWYGQKYNYIGSHGNEELIHYLLERLLVVV